MKVFNRQIGEEYQNMFEHAVVGIFQSSLDGHFLKINPAMAHIYGYDSPEDMLTLIKNIEKQIYVDAKERDNFLKVLKDNGFINMFEGQNYRKDGSVIWTQINARIVRDDEGKPLYVEGFVTDITSRKEPELALKDDVEKYRQLFEAESDAIFLIDNETGNILEVNEAATAMYGYSKEELLRKRNSDLSAEPEETQRVTQGTPINKVAVIAIPLRFHRKKDGTIFPVEITGRFFEWHGRPVHIAAIRDITERKKSEEALRASDERFRLSFQTSPDSININRLEDGLYVDINEGFTAITGYTREDAIGKSSLEINIWKNPNDRAKLVDELKKNGFVNNLEAKFQKKNGQVVTGLMSARIIMLNDIPHIISIMRDIESIKRTEETLQRQLKELTILHNIAIAASSSKSVDELIQRTTDTIAGTLHPDSCGVELVTQNGDMYQAHSSYRGASTKDIRKPKPLSIGVTGKVISTGKPIRLNDVSRESAYIEVARGIRSELCVPIKIQDRVIGTFNIESGQADTYTESDERLLTTVAGTLATAIEQLRLFETSQRHLQELTILNAVSMASTRSTSLDDLIESVTKIIGESLYPDNFGVLLFNEVKSALIPHPSYRGISNGKFPKSLTLDQGVSGLVAASGKSIRIANVRTYKKYIEVTSQVRSELCVPIKLAERVLGVINAESVRINAFSADDEQLLTTIASTLATAIEKLRLLETEKKQRQEAEALREATAVLTTSIELKSLYEIILDSLTKLIPFDSASIELFNGSQSEIVAGRSLKIIDLCIGKRFQYDAVRWGELESMREPIIIPNVQLDNRFQKHSGTECIRGWMGVPMIAQDRLVGFLNFDSSTENFFTPDHAALAQTYGNQAAIAIENARLFQEESRRSQIIEAMANIANEIATENEISPALDKISNRALDLLQASTIAIHLLQDDNKTIKVVTAQGTYRDQLLLHTLQLGTGITGNIIATGKPEIINDMFKDSRRVRVPGTPEEDAQRDTIMSAPLILRGKTIGAINAWRPRSSGLFNQSELNFLVSIANQTSMSIESIRLFQESARRAQEAHAIAEVGRDISSTLQLDVVLERIAQYAKELLRAETSAVYLLNSEGTLLEAIAAIGIESTEIKNDPLPIGRGILGNIALQKTGEIVNDTLGDERSIPIKGTEIDPNEHILGVPVLSKDKLTGLLAVWRTGKEEEFKLHELDFLSSLAQQAAVAIENARQFEAEQRHFEEAETLRQSAEALTSSLDIRNVLNAILINLSRVVPYDSSALFLIEEDMVRLTAGIGFPGNKNMIDALFPADNALLQEVWDSRKPVILDDAQADQRFMKWAAADQVRGWMGVPLSARGTMIGCITIDSYKPGAYNEHDATLAITFAHQAAAAIENARLYERSEHQVRQLTVLRDIDTAISSSFDLHVTLDFLLSHAVKELEVEAAAILLYNPDLQALSPHSSIGFTLKRNSTSTYIRIGEGPSGQVALRRKPMHIPDLSNSAESIERSLTDESFKSYFGIPLIGKGEIKGVLEIYSRIEINPTTDWLNFLHTLAGQAAIAIDNVQLFKNLQRSNQELILAYDTTLTGWGRALELRDKETQGHTNRVVKLTTELAKRMGIHGEELTHILRGTLLHDIGKMGIPDHILNKPGPLTEEEWVIMRQHPQFAFDLMNPIPYLRPALDIPYSHHERWDGSGYPHGLRGEDIPLAARIFAVVDIWDALLYERVYRGAWPEEKVIEYLKTTAGIELDPDIVEKFLELIEEEQYKNQAE